MKNYPQKLSNQLLRSIKSTLSGGSVKAVFFFVCVITVESAGLETKMPIVENLNSTATSQLVQKSVVPTVRLRAKLTVKKEGEDEPIHRLSTDGKTLATGNGIQPIKIWDAENGQLKATLTELNKHAPKAFSPDGQILVTNDDKTALLIDIETGRIKSTLRAADKGSPNIIYFNTFSPDGNRLLTVSTQPMVKLWDVTTGQQKAVLNCGYDYKGVSFSPNGMLIATGCKGKDGVKLWNGITGELKITLTGHASDVTSVIFSPDGQTLATESLDNTVKFWDVPSGQFRATLKGHRSTIYDTAFGPDGKLLATASRDRTVRLWNVMTGEQTVVLNPTTGIIRRVIFSPDGRTLVTLGEFKERAAKLWNVETGKLKATLGQHEGGVKNVLFSPNGNLIITASEKSVNVWNTATGEMMLPLKGARSSALFSQDGRILVTGGQDNTVLIWEIG